MSEENVEIMRRVYDAVASRDAATVPALSVPRRGAAATLADRNGPRME
jgi:hypothetical protein